MSLCLNKLFVPTSWSLTHVSRFIVMEQLGNIKDSSFFHESSYMYKRKKRWFGKYKLHTYPKLLHWLESFHNWIEPIVARNGVQIEPSHNDWNWKHLRKWLKKCIWFSIDVNWNKIDLLYMPKSINKQIRSNSKCNKQTQKPRSQLRIKRGGISSLKPCIPKRQTSVAS